MKFLSVCSGIEAASVAWNPIGWEAVGFSEIEKFPCALLKHHYPSVPNFGDMTKYESWPDATIDALCGGTPCQSFSVAGLRNGLDDPRGNLMLTFGKIAQRYRPKWIVWENVPGVLSSNKGRDFGAFLGLLAEVGYGFAYRVFDAQYFNLAQRRERVFVVGYLGDWRPAAAVLFDRASLQGHPKPSREAGEEITGTLSARTKSGGGFGTDFSVAGGLQPMAFNTTSITSKTNRSNPIPGDPCHTLTKESHPPAVCLYPVPHAPISPSLKARDYKGPSSDGDGDGDGAILVPCIAFHGTQDPNVSGPITHAMGRNNGAEQAGLFGSRVRRLTPMECERLMGFPENYTSIPYRGKTASDNPRYKALGNSWAVPCVRYIGERINMVNKIKESNHA